VVSLHLSCPRNYTLLTDIIIWKYLSIPIDSLSPNPIPIESASKLYHRRKHFVSVAVVSTQFLSPDDSSSVAVNQKRYLTPPPPP
ncbi:unnamed protein product, partial [Prunus brigantina]